MNLRMRILIKLGILISLLVVTVIAATPGSRCTIYARVGLQSFTIVGSVSANGRLCVAPPNIPAILRPLRNGVNCNTSAYVVPPNITVRAVCAL
jgi:hypothetical protein